MPKLKAETQQARRRHILDAAKRCIARRGLHGTSMQDICRQAGVSPGALYVYFASKEALIAAICDGERQEFAERLEALASAGDFMRGLRALGQEYVRTDRAKDHRRRRRWHVLAPRRRSRFCCRTGSARRAQAA